MLGFRTQRPFGFSEAFTHPGAWPRQSAKVYGEFKTISKSDSDDLIRSKIRKAKFDRARLFHRATDMWNGEMSVEKRGIGDG